MDLFRHKIKPLSISLLLFINLYSVETLSNTHNWRQSGRPGNTNKSQC